MLWALNLVIITCCLISTACLAEDLNCRFKPGCNANQCDPLPWNQLGVGEYLQRKEFPITCKEKDTNDVLGLYAAIAVNQQEIKELEQELSQLRRTNEEQANEFKKELLASKQEIFDLKQAIKQLPKSPENAKTDSNKDHLSQPSPSTCVQNGINETITPWINEGNLQSVVVNCQLFSVDNDGWITIQKRQNGEVNFKRNWETYARGFGNKDGEFWLGLRTIHQLTTTRDYKLRIELGFKSGIRRYAEYSTFKVGSEKEKFQLTISGYSGDVRDFMDYHNGQYSTTYDVDNDEYSGNCAQSSHGAWWYKSCSNSNLTRQWNHLLTSREMKIHLI